MFFQYFFYIYNIIKQSRFNLNHDLAQNKTPFELNFEFWITKLTC
jgi:hypothetical protein